jgi:hypothetical protein
MTKPSPDPEPVVTGADLEDRWRALREGFGRDAGRVLGDLAPAGLALVGVGLAALGGAYWLHRRTAGDAADPPPPGDADLSAETPDPGVAAAPPPANLDLIRQAVVRGLVEGLISSGVLPGTPGAPGTGVSSNA